ncbi:hypothetical protein [Vibrio mediterranei]|uniref:hypothetical protein n=1 Tax=Vibrio mediterranei TaxID=689 RepID=UPI0040690BDF
MEVQGVLRKFKINHHIIDDLASNLPFAQAYKLLQKQYPIARTVQMYEDDAIVQSDGTLLYDILIPAKTNG